MKIYKAVKNSVLGQGFDMSPWMKSFYESFKMNNHGGYDFACKTGEPIFYDVDIDGYVLNTEIDSSGGLGVNIITEGDRIFKHRYWHLKDFFVKAGDKVSVGQCIGWSDNTGASTGAHLHRDIKEMEKVNGLLKVKNNNNGTFGTIRWDEWFEDKFVLDVVGTQKDYLRVLLLGFIKKILI